MRQETRGLRWKIFKELVIVDLPLDIFNHNSIPWSLFCLINHIIDFKSWPTCQINLGKFDCYFFYIKFIFVQKSCEKLLFKNAQNCKNPWLLGQKWIKMLHGCMLTICQHKEFLFNNKLLKIISRLTKFQETAKKSSRIQDC